MDTKLKKWQSQDGTNSAGIECFLKLDPERKYLDSYKAYEETHHFQRNRDIANTIEPVRVVNIWKLYYEAFEELWCS